MEPKLPAPGLGPEQSPTYFGQNQERAHGETSIEQRSERLERQVEATPVTSMTAAQVSSIALPTVAPSAVSPVATPVTDMPLVANDDDLIEKEWVDKAKKIITTTKDDPYRREQEVGRLQADYLRKRYGKELGTPQ